MNSSNFSGSPLDGWYERPWIRDELFAASLTVITSYLVVALFLFECRQSDKNKGAEKSPASKIEDFLTRGTLCLIAAIFTLVRCFAEQIELRLGRASDLACKIYQHELVEVYHISLTCLYLLLWIRQLKMYRHRSLRHLSSAFLRICSYAVLGGIVGVSIASAASYLASSRLISSSYGCVYAPPEKLSSPPSSLPGIMLFVLAFVFQFALLGLLVYPLVKNYQLHLCCRAVIQQKHLKIRKTIVRISICTTICVVSDCIASSLLIFVYDGITPVMFYANIYTVNLLINILAVICSFADWRRRLIPCCGRRYESVPISSSGKSVSSAL